jgi:DNA-binding response OmpR family regulator
MNIDVSLGRAGMAKLLVVEDQHTLLQSMQRGLEAEGHQVFVATTGSEGYRVASTEQPEVIILDLLLPDGDGLQTLRRLRQDGFQNSVLIVTARDTVEDRITGLDTGADDYLIKPFAFGELLARLRALLRRTGSSTETTLKFADLEMDLLARQVTRNGVGVELTTRQFGVLEYLLRHKNQIVSREMLARDVWKAPTSSWTNVIEVQINQLRKKIERPDWPPLLQTIRGEGYLLGDRF